MLYWWLMKLLADVAMNEQENKMNVEKLAPIFSSVFSITKFKMSESEREIKRKHNAVIQIVLELSIESQMDIEETE